MPLRIRHISTRFALILAIAAVLPLLAYGLASLVSLQRGTRQSIIAGNQNVATRAAEEIERYVASNAAILKALAADLQNTGLEQWQQERILKNYVLEFREFREITLFDEQRAPVATSRIGAPHVAVLSGPSIVVDGVSISSMHVDEDLLPTSEFAIHLTRLNRPAGWLAGELNLEQMWRMVDQIRIGQHGFASVVDTDGKLIAHGDPDKKALVAQATNVAGRNPLVTSAAKAAGAPAASVEYVDDQGIEQLAVAATVPDLGWTVIVEQPTHEAYASALQLRRQLIVAISLALIVMVIAGLLFGRQFIAPIFSLQRATQSIADGNLETRVQIASEDEFGKLGDAFNSMANRLVELQENVKRQERHAMFGRIVGGLFHDLSHPIQNIGNHAMLLLHQESDAETREISGRTIQREIATLKRFMDDLRNVSKPRPVERFAMDLNGSVAEIIESMKPEAQKSGVTLDAQYTPGTLIIEGDRFALGRVYRNLITNAIQATAVDGRVSVTTRRVGAFAELEIRDTGSGIPPERLSSIFDNFVTTKRRGLGLGLPVSKQIVEQLDGTIAVESEVGRGTSFTIRFPARDDLSVQQAAS